MQTFLLPFDGRENRAVACIKAYAFLSTTSCSAHLTTVDSKSLAQAQEALNVTRFYGGGQYTELGGDFNVDEERNGYVTGIWKAYFTEGDRFRNPPLSTVYAFDKARKFDFLWGEYPRVVSHPYAATHSRNQFSDHSLLIAPYDWLY